MPINNETIKPDKLLIYNAIKIIKPRRQLDRDDKMQPTVASKQH